MNAGAARPLIDLSLGEPCYGPPVEARLRAAKVLAGGHVGYLPPAGLPDLRDALASKLVRANGMPALAEHVVVTSGASLALFTAFSLLCEPGDRVLLADPGFPLYALMARTHRLRIAWYPLRAERRHEPDWETVERLAPTSRVLVWNFPSNPVGAVAAGAWRERLAELVRRHPRLWIVSDEVYEATVYRGVHVSPGALPELAPRCISIFSFSKTYGMTGWRIGYAHIPETDLALDFARRHWSATMSASGPGQHAALGALAADPAYFEENGALLKANRDGVVAELRDSGLDVTAPDAGFFVWLDLRPVGMTGDEIAERCERDFAVRLMPGSHFGPASGTHARLTFAVEPERLAEGLHRFRQAVETPATATAEFLESAP